MKALIFIVALLATSIPARAEPKCFPSVYALSIVYRYGETVKEQATRNSPDGKRIEWALWVNEKTESWSLTATFGPLMCFVAASTEGYAGQSIADFFEGEAV